MKIVSRSPCFADGDLAPYTKKEPTNDHTPHQKIPAEHATSSQASRESVRPCPVQNPQTPTGRWHSRSTPHSRRTCSPSSSSRTRGRCTGRKSFTRSLGSGDCSGGKPSNCGLSKGGVRILSAPRKASRVQAEVDEIFLVKTIPHHQLECKY